MIDQGLTEEWPSSVVETVAHLEQGDIVEQPPFFYVGTAGHGIWQFTRDVGDPNEPDELFELDPDSCPPFGMITTETCDLAEEDAKSPRHPWFTVAPVYEIAADLLDENRLDALNRGKIAYLRRIDSEQLPPGVWVVDARVEFPIEKSWLVGRNVIRALEKPEERAAIAVFLGGRRDRPVLNGSLHNALIKHMCRWIEKLGPDRRAIVLDGVSEVRLVTSGSPLDPDGVGLLIVSDRQVLSDATKGEWDRKWEVWRDRLEKVGISLLGNAYKTYDTLTAREYKDSVEIRIDIDP